MESRLMTLFTRTPLHVGAGNSVGVVDLPIQRERHTRIPIIPGSSLKGVFADLWPDDYEKDDKGNSVRKQNTTSAWLFGNESDEAASAGALLIGEARVLAFPVRSAKGMFAWITCPLVLNRFKRETKDEFDVPRVTGQKALASSSLILPDKEKDENKLVLEEYDFTASVIKPDDKLVNAFRSLLSNDPVWEEIGEKLVVVSDELFKHFCEHACEVVTRIKIDPETGTVASGALFNQEQVPSETLFYTTIMAQAEKNKAGGNRSSQKALSKFQHRLEEEETLQIGGDETIGLGLCSFEIKENRL